MVGNSLRFAIFNSINSGVSQLQPYLVSYDQQVMVAKYCFVTNAM